MRHRRQLACLLLAGLWAALASPAAAGPELIAQRLPQIVYTGGPFLRQPEVTTVTFASEDPAIAGRLEAFGDGVTRSAWWRLVTEGNCAAPGDCIGPGHPGRHLRLDRALPPRIGEADLELLLEEEARDGGLSGLGPDAMVLVYLPAGVRLHDAAGRTYCEDGPRAYHRMLQLGGAGRFAYAAIPRCPDEALPTAVATHEILEAAANPDPLQRGFAVDPQSEDAGFTVAGVEPADPCGLIHPDRPWSQDGGFAVHRAWSNLAARGGHDPCVPDPAPRFLALMPRSAVVRLAQIGAEVTVALDAAADGPGPAWGVEVMEIAAPAGPSPHLALRLDRQSVEDGAVAHLTMRLLKRPASGRILVGLLSQAEDGRHLWPLLVSTR